MEADKIKSKTYRQTDSFVVYEQFIARQLRHGESSVCVAGRFTETFSSVRRFVVRIHGGPTRLSEAAPSYVIQSERSEHRPAVGPRTANHERWSNGHEFDSSGGTETK